jgi:3-deoxy-D-manno-octulosonic-acid transferase
MRWLLDALYLLVGLLLAPWLLYRLWRRGTPWALVRQRLIGLSCELPPGAVWFHGVSVGEVHLLRQLVAAFRQRHPERAVVVSSTTDTGLEEARKSFPDLPVIPFPLDFSWAVARTLNKINPSLVVLAESELWPNFIAACKRLQVPVAVVNARLSPRSLSRYRLLAPLARRLFGSLDLVVTQTEEYAANFLSLGAVPGQVHVSGNVKYDGALTARDNPRTAALRELLAVGAETVWVAGSTQAPEEEVVLGIYRRARERHPNLRLFLVPRQRDRFDEVAGLIERRGFPFVRRSRLTEPGDILRLPPGDRQVVLVDTIGDLGPLWGLAELAFVGGSLDGRRGGQNMIEPAAFGAAVTFGPHVWNFKEPARRLLESGGAYQVASAAELEQTILRLLADPAERRAMGASGRLFALAQQGATARTLELLDTLLEPPAAGGRAA